MPSSEFYKRHYGAMAEGVHHQRFIPTQKGNGFFGRIIRGSLIPVIKSVLPYLKNVALEGVGGLVDDLKSGKSFRDATTDQFKRSSETVLNDMAKRVKKQTGSGLRRRRRQKGAGIRRKKPVRKTGKRGRPAAGLFKV